MSGWLSDNEKYALIALEVRTDERIPLEELVPGYWAWSDLSLAVPPHWREWLGTIQTEAIEHSNLFLMCKTPSETPAVLDSENEILKRRVWGFYIGLLLSSTFTLHQPPIKLTGAQKDGEGDIRQQTPLALSSSSSLVRPLRVHGDEVAQAARFGQALEQLIVSPPPGGLCALFAHLQCMLKRAKPVRCCIAFINFAVALMGSFSRRRERGSSNSRAGRSCLSAPDTINLWVSFTKSGATPSI